MQLNKALEMKRMLEQKKGARYVVMRSEKRSLGVSPFYVAKERGSDGSYKQPMKP